MSGTPRNIEKLHQLAFPASQLVSKRMSLQMQAFKASDQDLSASSRRFSSLRLRPKIDEKLKDSIKAEVKLSNREAVGLRQ